jgi:hypothetical protein
MRQKEAVFKCDQIKEDEMGGTHSTHFLVKFLYKNVAGTPVGKVTRESWSQMGRK